MTFLGPLRAELFRLTRSRSGRLGLLAPALVGAGGVFVSSWLAALDAARRVAQGAKAAAPADVTAFGPLADALGRGSPVLALTALLLGAFSLVRERDDGALSQLFLARPRGAVVLGKTLGTMVYVLIAFLLLFAAAAAAAALSHDFVAHVEDDYEMASLGQLWLETARAAGAGLPALFGCVAFGVLVSAVSASTGAAAVGALVPFMLVGLFQGALGGAASNVFVTYVPFFGEHSPLSRLAKVARAFSDAYWEQGELWRAAFVPSAEAVAFVLLAWLVTRRRNA